MSLTEVCDTFLRMKVRPLVLPAEAAIEITAARIAHAGVATREKPPKDDLDILCRRIDVALAKGEQIDRKDLRAAPWCLWGGEHPLSETPARVDQLLQRLAEVGRRRLYRTLAAVYLHFFRVSRPGIQPVGEFLARHVAELGPQWARLQQGLGLFTPALVLSKIANECRIRGVTPDEILVEHGLRDPTSASGLRKEAYRVCLERLEGDDNRDPMSRLDLVRRLAQHGAEVRYEEHRVAAVRAAIRPFKGDKPDKAIRDAFLGLVLPLLGDPRVDSGRWNGCPDEEATIRKWLIEQSLRQFFDVVDRIAPDERWNYRRTFWNALYEKDYIDGAWVIFEKNGANLAKKMFKQDISFALIEPRGALPAGNAVLILQIGTLTVAEWSHVGQCNIWDTETEEGAPRLYNRQYTKPELEKRYYKDAPPGYWDGMFKHHSPRTYFWQKEISKYLKSRRNIELKQKDYEVR